jgi:hypothetical protein
LARINKLVEKPFENSIGQIINVGDQVVYVAHGRGNVSVGIGVYEGVNVGPRYYKATENVECSVRVGQIPVQRLTYKRNPNYQWFPYNHPNHNKREFDYYLYDENDKPIVEKDEWYFKKTTLPNMRIFKIDTPIKDLDKKRI